MTPLFSLEFLVAVLFIGEGFLFLLLFLFVKRVNKIGMFRKTALEEDRSGIQANEMAQESAMEVLALLEPLVKESKTAALEFDDLIREKKKISKDLNDALDSRIISINLLLSRASTLQKQLEEQQRELRRSVNHVPLQAAAPRQPDILDQQNQILDLYHSQMDVDAIAEQLSIPKGEVQLVVDLKEKFAAMEQDR
jgi:Na+-transporting methylmalonyl-CoA/oxaloacetate decarboxylase gamma subunit